MSTGQYPKRRETDEQQERRKARNPDQTPKKETIPIDERPNRDLTKHSWWKTEC